VRRRGRGGRWRERKRETEKKIRDESESRGKEERPVETTRLGPWVVCWIFSIQ
jgi:hypothetical protein